LVGRAVKLYTNGLDGLQEEGLLAAAYIQPHPLVNGSDPSS